MHIVKLVTGLLGRAHVPLVAQPEQQARQLAQAEVKSLPVEFKAEAEGIIEAYASVFGGRDAYGDQVRTGAFAKTIRERGPLGSKKIKALYNHDPYANLPVGTPQTITEDQTGLLTVTKMSRVQIGQDIYTLAQEGALSELSIGFNTIKAEYPQEENGGNIYRIITEVKLLEYSFVTFPADEAAIITGVKSLADLDRELDKWAKIAEVGMSTKGDRALSGENAKRILTKLEDLKSLLVGAVEIAGADPTIKSTPTPENEPGNHSLLSVLVDEAKSLERQGQGRALLSELLDFGRTL